MLRDKPFAGGHIPEVEVIDMYYKYHPIQVLVCKSTKYVPYYLTEVCKGLYHNHIYTRVGDTNTPKTGSANYSDVEKLWRIHFEKEHE